MNKTPSNIYFIEYGKGCFALNRRILELVMAVLLLVSFFLLSREAAMTVSQENRQADGKGVIVVDVGHGGDDPGMIGIAGVKEKDVNLAVALKLKSELEGQGYQAVLTRDGDYGLYEEGTANMKAQDLQKRIALMKEYQPLLTVSIHQNSYQDARVCGPQVFYYEHSQEGEKLANAIQDAMNEGLEVERPRAAKGNTTYYLLKRSEGILNIVECGFLTNEKEAKLLQQEEYQQKVAVCITQGICDYLAN